MPISIGSRFDRYEILSLLGAGGMGEVYLARDSRLDRKVALKILPPLYTYDKDRVRRFEKEAKAVSALNHPNIITIFEIGQATTDSGESHFIATEYIEGQTLRKKMRKDRLSVAEAVEITIQIAEALESAHSAGILHRDIKPENIMLRPDGYVKVLDFGLAKLTERGGENVTNALPNDNETDPGLVLGTATYMSPEQARAQKLDGRSDLFSLGIILYEMLAGRSPFHDNSASDVMAAILNRDPLPLSSLTGGTHSELERITLKALSKNRETRYQSAKELQTDLKNFRQRTASANDFTARPTKDDYIEPQNLVTRVETVAQTTDEVSAAGKTGKESFFREIRKHRVGVFTALLILVLAVAGLSFSFFHWLSPEPAPVFKNARFTRLAAQGRTSDAVISPDGKQVAYVIDDGGKRSLWLRLKEAGINSPPLKIHDSTDLRFRAPTFSHDGNYIFYVLRKSDSPSGDLYRVPTLGGTARKLLSGVSSPVALSTDDKKLAFVRELPGEGISQLLVADSNGGNERELARRKLPDSFSIEGPSWSPDEATIVCPVANFAEGIQQNVVAIKVADKSEKILLTKSWPSIGRVTWTENGKGILMSAREPESLTALGRQVWFVSYPKGNAVRITNDLNDYRGVTVSSDGATIAAVQINQISNLWVTPANDSSQARQITLGSGSSDGLQGLAWTPDNKLIYALNTSGKFDLWKINPDGSDAQQLTTDVGNSTFPSVSPDGRFIVFDAHRNSTGVGVWRLDTRDGSLKQLTFGQLDLDPRFSPSGQEVIFSSIQSGKRTLWKVSIEGGEPTQLLTVLSEYPQLSPDGKWLSCSYRDEASGAPARYAVLPIAGGAPIAAFDIPTTPWRLVKWLPDSSALTYPVLNNGVANIFSQSPKGGSPKKITDFKSNHIFAFDWSPDGKWLALARGLETREIVLISNFRE
jgi:serine/threonine protein kinase/Tol biopolymer transport system component